MTIHRLPHHSSVPDDYKFIVRGDFVRDVRLSIVLAITHEALVDALDIDDIDYVAFFEATQEAWRKLLLGYSQTTVGDDVGDRTRLVLIGSENQLRAEFVTYGVGELVKKSLAGLNDVSRRGE